MIELSLRSITSDAPSPYSSKSAMKMPLSQSSNETQNLYSQDFYLWIQHNINFLEDQRFSQLDIPHLIEELKTMGRSEKNALKSNLIIILMHLLKYQFQPEKRSNSWLVTLFEHRRRIRESLEDSPSLNNYYQDVLEKCYNNARKEAALETGLTLTQFPPDCLWTPEEILDANYLPE